MMWGASGWRCIGETGRRDGRDGLLYKRLVVSYGRGGREDTQAGCLNVHVGVNGLDITGTGYRSGAVPLHDGDDAKASIALHRAWTGRSLS